MPQQYNSPSYKQNQAAFIPLTTKRNQKLCMKILLQCDLSVTAA